MKTLLELVAIMTFAANPEVTRSVDSSRYVTAVLFYLGKYRFFTGDVIFDPAGFRDDLRKRFDNSRGITVYHSSEVPKSVSRKR